MFEPANLTCRGMRRVSSGKSRREGGPVKSPVEERNDGSTEREGEKTTLCPLKCTNSKYSRSLFCEKESTERNMPEEKAGQHRVGREVVYLVRSNKGGVDRIDWVGSSVGKKEKIGPARSRGGKARLVEAQKSARGGGSMSGYFPLSYVRFL